MIVFDVIEKKPTTTTLFAFGFFTQIIVARPKVSIHSKFQSFF